jgi:NADPH:quinone reductase-like Zn-dependent oxidoreductase
MRLGFEVAGVVSGVGDDAEGPAGPVRIGDEVLAYPVDGGYAEAVTVPASAVIPKPAEMPFEQAAGLLLTGVTAYHLVEATGVRAGDTVLVHAASGGVGLIAAQLAVERDATVIGTASERHHDRLRGHGVVPVGYGDGLADRVRDLAPGGVDVALDTVGTDEAVDTSLALVPDRDRIVSIAAFGRAEAEGYRVSGGTMPASARFRDVARPRLIELAAGGQLVVPMGRTFPLTEAREALELLRSGHPGGKLALLP